LVHNLGAIRGAIAVSLEARITLDATGALVSVDTGAAIEEVRAAQASNLLKDVAQTTPQAAGSADDGHVVATGEYVKFNDVAAASASTGRVLSDDQRNGYDRDPSLVTEDTKDDGVHGRPSSSNEAGGPYVEDGYLGVEGGEYVEDNYPGEGAGPQSSARAAPTSAPTEVEHHLSGGSKGGTARSPEAVYHLANHETKSSWMEAHLQDATYGTGDGEGSLRASVGNGGVGNGGAGAGGQVPTEVVGAVSADAALDYTTTTQTQTDVPQSSITRNRKQSGYHGFEGDDDDEGTRL
jgi:hypothetical protein